MFNSKEFHQKIKEKQLENTCTYTYVYVIDILEKKNRNDHRLFLNFMSSWDLIFDRLVFISWFLLTTSRQCEIIFSEKSEKNF